MQIEFYYDIVCPFAYIASTRVEEAVGRHNGIVIWKPVLLGGIYDLIKAEQGKAGSASDVMPVNKKIAFSKDLERTIKRYKIDLNFHKNHPVKSLNAQRLLTYFKNQNKRKILSHKFFEAYWVKNLEVDKFEVLFKIVHECFGDFDKEDFLKTSKNCNQDLRAETENVVKLGAPGVPYFVIKSNEGGLSCFWGQDRIHFVESAITGRSIPQDRLYITKPLKFPQRIKFFFDFSSPWAFVGYMQLKRLKVEFGNLLEIECFPILLGKLFQNIGTPNMPALAMTSQKRDYYSKDLYTWIKYWNDLPYSDGSRSEKIENFGFPSFFPIRTVLPLRVALQNPFTIDCIFKAAWTKEINIGDENDLLKLLVDNGFEGNDLIKNSHYYKDILIENTKYAVETGICGVPSYMIGEDLIWGQDRMNVVADLIHNNDHITSSL